MYNIRGFLANSALVNNTPRTVARIGELSIYSSTFARDRFIFSGDNTPLTTLFVFASFEEISATEKEDRPVPAVIEGLSRRISDRLYSLAESGDLVNDRDFVRDLLLNEFVGDVQNVIVGQMVNDGNRWMPSSLVWEGTSPTNPYRAQYWFADEEFRNEYDLFEVNVTFPINNLEDLFALPSEMDDILSTQITAARITSKVSEIADGDPYTDVITDEFEWISAADANVTRLLPITVIIYGDAGRSPDVRRKAIADWILENSNIDEDQWRQILPDVFSPTEFIIAPSWNRYSIPSGTIADWTNGEYPEGVLSAGTYMPGGNASNQIEFMKEFAKGVGYTDEYVTGNVNLVTFVYKSIQASIVGGFRNRNDITQFLDRWPDYIAVGTGSIDFARMSAETQRMVNLIIDMLRVAETMTLTSTIPRKYTRTIREGVLYLTATFERTQILVVTRSSVAQLYQYTTGSENVRWSDPE